MAEVRVDIAGEEIWLMPERTAYWPRLGWLICADLHWGKAETFQHWGLPVPSAVLEKDLARLSSAIAQTGATKIVVIGDLVHARVGLSEGVRERVANFFKAVNVPMLLIRGNHDRALREIPAGWVMEIIEGSLDEGPFRFRHDDGPSGGLFQWLGHLHPLWVTKGAGDRLRLPCFWIQERALTLPAFSAFTAGQVVKAGLRDRIFLPVEDAVLEAPGARKGRRASRSLPPAEKRT